MIILAMKPMKNTAATEARIRPISPIIRKLALDGVDTVDGGYLGDEMTPNASQWREARQRILGLGSECAARASQLGEPVLLVDPDICLGDLQALRFEMGRDSRDLPVTLVPIYNKLLAAVLKAIP
jgi:hypothetical protein